VPVPAVVKLTCAQSYSTLCTSKLINGVRMLGQRMFDCLNAHPTKGIRQQLDQEEWNNEVTSPAFRPYDVFLPLVLRNH
jgi:hypothetical protein